MHKSEIARKVFRSLRNTSFGKTLYTLSTMYIEEYKHFSYDFALNGERQIIAKLAKTMNDKVIFFDVGANVGDWSQYVIDCFKNCEGHLFEVSQGTFEKLNRRLGDKSNLVINNIALSNEAGAIEYQDYGNDFGGNTLVLEANYAKRPSAKLRAEAKTGDGYCVENHIGRINYLKIDVEGFDYYVLQGFEKMLQQKSIDIIQFEYGYTHADAKTLMRDFFKLLEGYGYEVGQLRQNKVNFKNFEYSDNDFKSGPNYVAALPKFKKVLESF